jgi:3,4-dihydroxy 2-butanone 4-phosphate synthase/GTP cyclohydrolase II
MAGVGVITELVGDNGVPLSGDQTRAFAGAQGLPFLRIADLIRARRSGSHLVTSTARARLPLAGAEFTVHSYTSVLDGVEHLALTLGDLAAADARPDGVLVRIHSECLTGDVFGSQRCDCGEQLMAALERIDHEGAGAFLYMRQEGRGIGLANKLRAYELQDLGLDTVEANIKLGFAPDLRDYGVAAQIIRDLGYEKIRLLTNNPRKITALREYGVNVAARESLEIEPNADNARYLATKRDRLGHLLERTAIRAPHASRGNGKRGLPA